MSSCKSCLSEDSKIMAVDLIGAETRDVQRDLGESEQDFDAFFEDQMMYEVKDSESLSGFVDMITKYIQDGIYGNNQSASTSEKSGANSSTLSIVSSSIAEEEGAIIVIEKNICIF